MTDPTPAQANELAERIVRALCGMSDLSTPPAAMVATVAAHLAPTLDALASSNSIRTAEKKILLQEIEQHTATKAALATAKKRIDELCKAGTNQFCEFRLQIEALEDKLAQSEAANAALKAESEGRRKVLCEKAEELIAAWARAENAEGRAARAEAALKLAREALENALKWSELDQVGINNHEALAALQHRTDVFEHALAALDKERA